MSKANNLKTLICDNDTSFILNIKETLSKYGFNLKSSHDINNAINIIKTSEIDILLIDSKLFSQSKYSIMEEIRSFNNDMEIILLTESSDNIPPIDILLKYKTYCCYLKYENNLDIVLLLLSARRTFLQNAQINKLIEEQASYKKTLEEIHESFIDNERLCSIGKLVGSISHNMKNPLLCIGSSIHNLKDLINEYSVSIGDSSVTEEDHHEIADDMNKLAKNMYEYYNYLNDLIETVKEQSVNSSQSVYRSFTINDLTAKLNILLKDELKIHKCSLNTEYNAPQDIIIRGRLISLIQVLNNIIINAAQSYENGGEIDFIIEEQKNTIKFTVKDCGKGIPDNIKEKLLKEMVTTKGKDGTGIGIYSSYQVIKTQFSGEMEFVSQQGKGTTFIITVPLS
ncbi:MAG: hybrid sensor histidine kinase/response regulator [Bacillota bacterium]|nr:hybrid sensor histidine kinase/response regulator [Bacillota bacterium]